MAEFFFKFSLFLLRLATVILIESVCLMNSIFIVQSAFKTKVLMPYLFNFLTTFYPTIYIYLSFLLKIIFVLYCWFLNNNYFFLLPSENLFILCNPKILIYILPFLLAYTFTETLTFIVYMSISFVNIYFKTGHKCSLKIKVVYTKYPRLTNCI